MVLRRRGKKRGKNSSSTCCVKKNLTVRPMCFCLWTSSASSYNNALVLRGVPVMTFLLLGNACKTATTEYENRTLFSFNPFNSKLSVSLRIKGLGGFFWDFFLDLLLCVHVHNIQRTGREPTYKSRSISFTTKAVASIDQKALQPDNMIFDTWVCFELTFTPLNQSVNHRFWKFLDLCGHLR